MKKSYAPTYVGFILLILFTIQFLFKINWTWLISLQQDQMFKRWSGLAIAIFITIQWMLTLYRVVKRLRPQALKIASIHKWLGALSPILFYLHSTGMGYGYLALLAYLFMANTLLGYINLDVIKNNNEFLFKAWMIIHVALSIIITALMFFHISMVFYYK